MDNAIEQLQNKIVIIVKILNVCIGQQPENVSSGLMLHVQLVAHDCNDTIYFKTNLGKYMPHCKIGYNLMFFTSAGAVLHWRVGIVEIRLIRQYN